MLPVIAGTKTTKFNILVYSLAMFPVAIAPYFFNLASIAYLIISSLMTIYYNYLCFKLFKEKNTKTQTSLQERYLYTQYFIYF